MYNLFFADLFLEYFYANYPLLCLVIVFCTSLIIGSLLNMIIYRLPLSIFNNWRNECYDFLELDEQDKEKYKKDNNNNISILKPFRSICRNCKHKIAFYDNIPLLSYILLKGKCRHCSAHISLQYPFIELITAIASVIVVLTYGLNITSVLIILLTYLLILIATIDFEHYIIPDHLNYIGLWLGLLVNISMFQLIDIKYAILGAVVGYLLLWTIYWLFKLIRGKEGFGYGDFKLTALFGAWFGVFNLFPMLMISAVVAIFFAAIAHITNQRSIDKPFPFGPYLAIAGWIVLILQRSHVLIF